MTEQAEQEAQLEAAREFVNTWIRTGLAQELIPTYTCTLTCSEAEALANLFEVFGHVSIAARIIEQHSEHDDDPDDWHYSPQEG